MNPTKLYDWMIGNGGGAQPVAQPAAATVNTAQPPAAPTSHAAYSWVGLVIAVIALRLVYEFSE